MRNGGEYRCSFSPEIDKIFMNLINVPKIGAVTVNPFLVFIILIMKVPNLVWPLLLFPARVLFIHDPELDLP